MKIIKSTQPTTTGDADKFMGTVLVDVIQTPGEQSTLSCVHVRFTPGARTAWHTHSKGQTLYVTDGVGRVGRRDGEVMEIRPGDVIFIGSGEEHWHGAAPDRFMAHVAIAEADENGQVVTWGEHVINEEHGSV